MGQLDDLQRAGERLDAAHRAAWAAERAGDFAGWMAAQEEVWAAEAEVAAAQESAGWLFALLLRCALDHPTVEVQGLAAALRPAAGRALAGQVEWQRRRINELTEEVKRLAVQNKNLALRMAALGRDRPERVGEDGAIPN